MKKRQGYRVALLFIVMAWLPVSIFAEERSLDTSNLPSIGLPPQPQDSVVKTRDEKEKAQLKKKRDEADVRARSAVDSLKKALMEKKQPASISTYIDPVTGMEFVYVKGGCYQMGNTFDGGASDEKPVHEVCVGDFWIGRYEVTQGEWTKVMGDNPSKFKKGSRYPVENVSWDDAQVFIKKLNGQSGLQCRLPTEAQWEYAARSGGKKEEWAGTNDGTKLGRWEHEWGPQNSGDTAHEVGTRKPNGLGLYDMGGNVLEWCWDWYDRDYYAHSPRDNPQGPSFGPAYMDLGGQASRVVRGGSWMTIMRAAARKAGPPDSRVEVLGFRLVCQ